jgi:hypothetical protein
MKSRKVILPLVLAIASGAFLAAAQPQWGVQGALSVPTGDLSDSANLGISGGGNAKFDFGRGNGLMARGDLTFYGQKDGFSDSSAGVAADYTYHLDHRQRGIYFLGGLSVLDYRWSRSDGSNYDSSALGLDLGVGYDVDRHVGLQARYTAHSVSDSELDALNLGVTYTF